MGLRRAGTGVRAVAALLAAVAAGAAGAASAGGPPEAGPGPAIGRTWVHDCPDGPRFVVEVLPDLVRLYPPGGGREAPATLPRAISASGARFAEGDWLYWSKGREAAIGTPAGRWAGCTGREIADPWQAARLRGVRLRAIGQEPGWVVEIGPDLLVALLDYGARILRSPAAAPPEEGEATARAIRTDGGPLVVRAEEEPCRDAMSGERFALTVRIEFEGRRLRGCGMRLE